MCKIILLSILLFLLLKPCSVTGALFVSFRENDGPIFDGTLKINTQPVNQTDCKGNKVTFSVIAEEGSGKIHYLWKRKRPNDAAFVTFGAADSTKLAVYNIGVGSESPDGTLYQVTVSDQTDLLISESAALTINEITGIAPSGVASYTVNEGTNLRFSVLTSGNAPLSYQWIKKFGNSDWRNLTDNQTISGSQSVQLNFTKISLADSGIYKVRVSFPTLNGNQCSETSTITRTIHVKQVADTIPPIFLSQTNRNIAMCPEPIEQATWDENTKDILPARNNYYRLQKNSDLFDLSETIFHDNFTPPSGLVLHWGIWTALSTGNPVADEAGKLLDDVIGQISLHTENIDFECTQNYLIVFWLEDKAGNLTPETGRLRFEISVAPRPQIIALF